LSLVSRAEKDSRGEEGRRNNRGIMRERDDRERDNRGRE
jgi:hypothetical protein